jgi:hypothetical protein
MTVPRRSIPLVFLLLISLNACTTIPKTTTRMDFSSPEAVLALIDGRFPHDASLQALADLHITSREGSYPLRLAILLNRPSSLRVEAIPLIGPPSFFLSIHAGSLRIYLAESRQFYTGRATRENIARYLPVKMDPAELTALLTGTFSPTAENPASMSGRLEGLHYRIDMEGASKHTTLWVRTADGFLERIESTREQNLSYRVYFEAPFREEGMGLPKKITISYKDEESGSIRIRYTDIRLQHQADPASFVLPVPPGVKTIELE